MKSKRFATAFAVALLALLGLGACSGGGAGPTPIPTCNDPKAINNGQPGVCVYPVTVSVQYTRVSINYPSAIKILPTFAWRYESRSKAKFTDLQCSSCEDWMTFNVQATVDSDTWYLGWVSDSVRYDGLDQNSVLVGRKIALNGLELKVFPGPSNEMVRFKVSASGAVIQ